jgi:Mg2+-importing ATPase
MPLIDTARSAGHRHQPAVAEPQQLELAAAAALPAAAALSELGSSALGLSSVEASRRLSVYGPNVLLSHGVSALSVLVRQLRSYLLLLLLVAAVVSAVVGDRTEALIIGGIMLMSVGLSFLNEYRSEKAVEALHSQIRHLAFVDRDGQPTEVNVTEIVPGDLVHLRVGDVIPADLRLIEAHELECDESLLTGESQVAAKTAEARPRVVARSALLRVHGHPSAWRRRARPGRAHRLGHRFSARSHSVWASGRVRRRSSRSCSNSRACSRP